MDTNLDKLQENHQFLSDDNQNQTKGIGTTKEMDLFALEHSRMMGYKTFAKICSVAPPDLGPEDISSELLLRYVGSAHLISKDKQWRGYISRMFYTASCDIMMKIFDDIAKNSQLPLSTETEIGKEYQENGLVEHVVIETKNPEVLLLSRHEEQKMSHKVDVLLTDIEDFCTQFEVPFDPNDSLKSLRSVLELTLNQYSDEQFKALSLATQRRLADLGEALINQGLYLRTTKGKLIVVGMTEMIKTCFEKGINRAPDVLKELDKQGILYNKQSVQVMVSMLRRHYGLPRYARGKYASLKPLITKEFDQGRGFITVPDVAARLKYLGVFFIPSSLQAIVHELRKQYGLKKK